MASQPADAGGPAGLAVGAFLDVEQHLSTAPRSAASETRAAAAGDL